MKILVTGAAGFIGFHLCLKLAKLDYEVCGLDNINDYYDPSLKQDRLRELGFDKDQVKRFNKKCKSSKYERLYFSRIDLENEEGLNSLFSEEKFDVVCNLAAQAGVRYSIENPKAYILSLIHI